MLGDHVAMASASDTYANHDVRSKVVFDGSSERGGVAGVSRGPRFRKALYCSL